MIDKLPDLGSGFARLGGRRDEGHEAFLSYTARLTYPDDRDHEDLIRRLDQVRAENEARGGFPEWVDTFTDCGECGRRSFHSSKVPESFIYPCECGMWIAPCRTPKDLTGVLPMTTGLYLDRIELPKARVANREPYILAVTVNAFGPEYEANEIRLSCDPIRGVKKGKPQDFDPPLELFPPSLHGGLLASRIIVMESDSDFRRLGERLAGIADRLRGTSLGKRLAQGAAVATSGIAAAGLAEVAPLVIERLKKAGDDFLGEVSLSCDGSPGEFVVDSDNGKVRLTLRVAESGDAEVDVIPGSDEEADGDDLATDPESFASPTRWAQIEVGSPCLAVVPGHGASFYRGVVAATGDNWADVEFPDWEHVENAPESLRVERLKDIQIPQDEEPDELDPEVI